MYDWQRNFTIRAFKLISVLEKPLNLTKINYNTNES